MHRFWPGQNPRTSPRRRESATNANMRQRNRIRRRWKKGETPSYGGGSGVVSAPILLDSSRRMQHLQQSRSGSRRMMRNEREISSSTQNMHDDDDATRRRSRARSLFSKLRGTGALHWYYLLHAMHLLNYWLIIIRLLLVYRHYILLLLCASS